MQRNSPDELKHKNEDDQSDCSNNRRYNNCRRVVYKDISIIVIIAINIIITIVITTTAISASKTMNDERFRKLESHHAKSHWPL